MAANDPPTYANNTAIVEAVGRGEVPMGLVNHYYDFRARAEDPDLAVENHFFPEGDLGSLLLVTAGRSSRAPARSDDAEASIEFLLSTEERRSTSARRRSSSRWRPGPSRTDALPPFDEISSTRSTSTSWAAAWSARRADRCEWPRPLTGADPPRPGGGGRRSSWRGVFAAPLAYLVWRTATGDERLGELYTSSATLTPLRNTLVLAGATAASTAVLGTALAWVTTRTDLPLRRMWAVLRRAAARVPLVRGGPGVDSPRCRPAACWTSRWAPSAWRCPAPGVLGRVAGAHAVHLPLRAAAGGGPARQPAPLAGGERPPARARGPFAVFRTIVVPQVRGAIGAGALLVFLYALSDFGASCCCATTR